jgi:hypothetical protein
MLGRAIPLDRLARILASGNQFALHDLAASLPQRLQPAVGVLGKAFALGLASGGQTLGGSRLGLRFDLSNPYNARAARTSGAAFVRGVTDETRRAIRTVVARAFNEGITPRDTARLLRPMIGLTERQATAVVNRQLRLVKAGWSVTDVSRLTARYAEQLRRRRALTIARTEIIRAEADGALASWRQAQQSGLLSQAARKIWTVSDDDRLCPFCAPLDGATATLDGEFSTGLTKVQGPPLHPNCRCAIAVDIPVPPREGAK